MKDFRQRIQAAFKGFSGFYDEEISLLQGQMKILLEESQLTESKYLQLDLERGTLIEERNKLQLDLRSSAIVPEHISALAQQISGKYPDARITYQGYPIRTEKGIQNFDIDLPDFIHVLPSHVRWCESKGLTLKLFLLSHPDLSFEEAIDGLRLSIWRAYLGRKRYAFDQDLYGFPEYWSPRLDAWYLKELDCEDSTNDVLSLFKAAGLTGPLESFSWNVCGNTFSYYGHSTIHAYSLVQNIWKHMETTITRTEKTAFSQLPEIHDASDPSNIKDVWWSFNSQRSRHSFVTDAAADSFKQRDMFKNIVIG